MQFSLKYYKSTILVPVILVLALIFDSFISTLINCFPNIEIIRAPSNSALIALFLGIHNQYLWHLPIFNKLVNIPDMRGRYSGKIKSNWNGENKIKDCKIEISQTASSISIRSYFNNEEGEKTSSKSLIEQIKEEDGFYQLYFFYLNTGTLENSSLDCHEGANSFKFIPSTKDKKAKLIGNYFTNRQVQTKGIIEVEFESKKLRGEF
ncbi:hypothetical protein DFQ04_2768 [Algoriphagus boseongensis]|uniref:CD-NTase-associated protein 15 domain-containing protein n=1 Tax=Algoriphagus boseongensis TaxID=1442587 RepID=A0A4R6T3Q3_9BACT|nr:hypothetical protein [Algoriphagus boseongensis]TDQ16646.1 hypothetical protein DFQ04_2768 [Algoriphagus boseongensis]